MILVPSCSCLCPIYWSQVLSREWRCSWSSADRRCSNYIWVITILLPTEMRLILEIWRSSQLYKIYRTTKQLINVPKSGGTTYTGHVVNPRPQTSQGQAVAKTETPEAWNMQIILVWNVNSVQESSLSISNTASMKLPTAEWYRIALIRRHWFR